MAGEIRRPLLVSSLGAAGFLGLFQAVFLALRNQDFGPEMAFGLARLGIVVAFLTMLLLVLPAWALRRRHADWPSDRLRASWAACFGLAAAVAGWMIGDVLAPCIGLSGRPRSVFALMAAVVIGRTASFLQPPGRWLKAWAVASLVLLALCFVPPQGAKKGGAAAEPSKTAIASRPDAPDVVLISIDTLRADHLGLYGQSPTLTPEIDRWAGEGVVFERTLAAAPWTTPSVASMLTGLPTARHGAGLPLHSGMTFLRSPLDDKFTTLAEHFKAAGYRTRAVVTNGFLSAESGMAQGFERFENPSLGAWFAGMLRDLPLTRLVVDSFPPATWGDYRAEGATSVALSWLGETSDQPLFLWVHYIDTHVPYKADPTLLDPAALVDMIHAVQPPLLADGTVVGEVFGAIDLVRGGMLWLGPEDRRRLMQYYKSSVQYTDKHVGRLLAALRERRSKRKVVAALTADHGEEFWDHGHVEHGHDYYREITWVPLVFWGPAIVPAGRRVKTPTGLVDIAPTLLELAGLPAPAPATPDAGRSVVPLFTSEAEADKAPPRFCGGNLYGLPAVLMEEGPWRCILRANDVQELYDVTHDPQERRNLAFSQPDVAHRCRTVLQPQLAALMHTVQGSGPAEMSQDQLEAIRAMGYAR